MTDFTELKRLADSAPMAMTITNGGEEHKALIAFTDEVKRLFGNDVGMARVLIAENEALRAALIECTASLEGEVLQKYHGQKPDDMHPVTRRGHGRDMAEINGYRALSKEG
ncbi:hypothetical protein [Pseudomonas mohnii]